MLFSIGPFTVHIYGVMVALGVLVATLIAYREAGRRGLSQELVLDFALWLLVLGIIGARVGYVVIAGPLPYLQNPWQFLRIQDGGLSIHGAVIGGILAGLLFCRRNRLPFWRMADVFAPGLALGIAIGRVGCDVFGRPMASPWPWGVMVGGRLLHPAQVYEFILDYFLFLYLWRQRKRVSYEGQLFLRFIIFYAAIRGVVEFVRYNPTVIGPLSVAHVASLVFMAAAVLAGAVLRNRARVAGAGSPKTEVAAASPGGLAASLEDSLAWQLVLLALAIGVSLLIFYSL